MKRKDILTLITANVSETGGATHIELRLYTENRISYRSFKEAVAKGVRIFQGKKMLETHCAKEMMDGEAYDHLWKN